MPELRVGWSYEYLDTDRSVTAGFVGSPGVFTLRGDDPSRSAAVVRTGMTVFINEMVSVYGFYLGDLRNDRMYNGGSLGVRLRFF